MFYIIKKIFSFLKLSIQLPFWIQNVLIHCVQFLLHCKLKIFIVQKLQQQICMQLLALQCSKIWKFSGILYALLRAGLCHFDLMRRSFLIFWLWELLNLMLTTGFIFVREKGSQSTRNKIYILMFVAKDPYVGSAWMLDLFLWKGATRTKQMEMVFCSIHTTGWSQNKLIRRLYYRRWYWIGFPCYCSYVRSVKLENFH